MYKTIVEAVLDHGQKLPDRIAIGFKNQRISYRELCSRIKSTAAILREDFAIEKADHVMLSAVSKPEYVVVLLALQYLGAITVPVDKAALEENIADVYVFNQAKIIFTDTKITNAEVHKSSLAGLYKKACEMDAARTEAEKSLRAEPEAGEVGETPICTGCKAGEVEEKPLRAGTEEGEKAQMPLRAVCEDDEIAEILFTTGTTGRPKGAMLSYGNIYASTHNTWEGVGMLPEDVLLIPLPLNHSVGMRVLRTALYIGATVVIQNGFTFSKELIRNVDEFSCTAFVCVPAVLERLYRQMGEDFINLMKKLRYIEIGAGSLSYDMKKKLTAQLPETRIFNTWGSTETGGAIFLEVSRHQDKLTSLGKPVSGIRLKVVDTEGNAIEAHDIDSAGRMILQGPMCMKGYYHLEKETAEALQKGWLFTNDLVYTDEDGFVYMLGRADDIINVGGEKVSPIEVENIASEYPEIQECACIGVEDPEGILGQVPLLCYVPEVNANPAEKDILRFLADRMESWKLPKLTLRMGELPRNRMKKLDRKKLRSFWEEAGDSNLSNPVLDAILSRRSVRNFTEKEIPRAVMEQIMKCALQAPSANNMQTWRFFVLQDAAVIAGLKDAIEKTAAEKKVKFYGMNNPTTVVIITNDKRNANGAIDAALAAENIMIAAQSLGIGSVWNNALHSICDEPEIRALLSDLGVAARHKVCAMLCLGYPAETPKKIERRTDVITWK